VHPIVDAPVFPFEDQEAQKLLRYFAGMYPEMNDALRFVEKLGIDPLAIRRGDRAPLDIWHELLSRAAQDGVTRKLVQALRDAHPRNTEVSLLDRLLAQRPRDADADAIGTDFDLERYLRAVERQLEYLTAGAHQNQRLVDAFVLPNLVSKNPQARISWPDLDWERPIALVGGAGSGKSTLLRHLAYVTACKCRAAGSRLDDLRRASLRLPVLVDLHDAARLTSERIAATDLVPLLASSGLAADRVKQLIDDGDAVVMFDGFDEVPDDAVRCRLAERIRRLQGGGKRPTGIVVTSRTSAWTREVGTGFIQIAVQPLEPDQIDAFVANSATGDAVNTARIRRTLRSSPQIRKIATNPQLLTMLMVVLQDDPGRTLSHRVLVYEECIRRLTRDARRFVKRSAAELTDMLTQLALAMHGGDEPRLALRRAGQALEPFEGEIERKLEELELGTGLIVQSARRQVEFAHHTFQEYLAARAYAQTAAGRQVLLQHVEDPTWAETLALAAGVLADQNPEELLPFFEAVLSTPALPPGGALSLDALRAWAPRVAAASVCFADLEGWDLDRAVLAPVRRAHELILPVLENVQIDLRHRVEIANGLGTVEDPRLLRDRWIRLPATTTLIGSRSDEAWPQESPPQRVSVAAFWMQRWPVTVGEYRDFVDNDGYTTEAWWDTDARTWLTAQGKPTRPHHWDLQVIRNHPVTGISYWEARAYCRWLSSLGGIPDDWIVRLPTEAEWERAARGPHQLENERARFPWGERWNDAAANSATAGFGLVPVGVFPRTPLGFWDLAGNVMERCLDRFARYGARTDDGPCEHVIRGGSFLSFPLDLRVSVRNSAAPELRLRDLGFRCVAVPGATDQGRV
jgi:formylglycine-generating enzyme required for sulfatase activity